MTFLLRLLGIDSPSSISGVTDWVWRAASPLPIWVIVLLALAGLAAAALNFLPHNVMTWKTRTLLAIIRVAGFALLLLMLCQLEARLTFQRELRPTVAILTDTSASMGLQDSGNQTRLAAARDFASGPLKALAEKADLVRYRFDWKLDTDADAEPARPTRLIEAIADAARRENDLRAMIVLTDGNDTAGNRGELLAPALAARRLPVFPVVFGSAAAPKLARVKITSAADYVRLGDELRLAATLSANDLGEQSVTARLMEEGVVAPLAVRENVRLGKEPADISFVIKPEREGDHTYRVVVDGVKDAVSQSLQVAEHRVSVLNAKIRVLYLDIPRDERKILGNWLARDPVVDLATLTMMPKGGWYAQGALQHKNAGEGLPGAEPDLHKYDVIVLGDIPRSYFREGGDVAETKMQWLAEFVSRRGGGLVMLGGRSVYAAGQYQDSTLARLAPFTIEATNEPQVMKTFKITPTVSGLSHPLMALAPDAAANREAWFDLPSLDGNNRVGKVKPGASLLAVRDLAEGPMPIIALQNVGKGQVLGLAIDTTWRWEMMRPAEGEDYFRKFWGNALRLLAPDPRVEPDRPQILRQQSSAAVGRTISLSTRLVDSVYQPVRNAEVRVKVTSPSGRVTHFLPCDGRDSPGLYQYDIALDEPGDWQVAVTNKDKTVTDKITAGTGLEELDDPRANLPAMTEFAKATGGTAFVAGDAEGLLPALDLTPRRVTETATIAVWNLPLTMIAMIVLVCLDTWLRKRRGLV
ncbi:MAG TPA: glutamine amidotransferase [Chthoniobacteraceae bacterium]|jgi:uncharacterized membrane protein|nr:glutamine amidotransferase [Chthoniobacteraceae bacterium]